MAKHTYFSVLFEVLRNFCGNPYMELYKSTEFHAKGQILQALTGISKESTIFLYISWEIQIQLYSLGYLVTRNRRKIEGE